eukprot:scaffold2271_cov130-Cylindrotheca_fusiformis.AAC.20
MSHPVEKSVGQKKRQGKAHTFVWIVKQDLRKIVTGARRGIRIISISHGKACLRLNDSLRNSRNRGTSRSESMLYSF